MKAWQVFGDKDTESYVGLLHVFDTRQNMFEYYGVETAKQWVENVGYDYSKVEIKPSL